MDRPLHILHLEDDPYDVELIQETLKAEGLPCTIVSVNNRSEFLSAMGQKHLDIILADFVLPAFNGLEALALAQEKCPDVPFIFVSGAIGEEMAIESLKQGATDYVLKHRLSSLVPAIRRALREVEERRQRQLAEEQIRHSKNQLAAILSGITEGITVQQPQGTLIYANDLAAQLVGYSSAEALMQAPLTEFAQKFELRDEWDDPFPFEQLPGRLALQGQNPPEVLLRFRSRADGEERWSVVSATPIFDEAGQVQFAVNIFRDVTERTRLFEAERKARQTAEAVAVRIASLQVVTASLSEALTPKQVTQIVVEQGIAVLAATAGSVVLRNEQENTLEIIHAAGYTPELLRLWRRFPLDAPAPLAEVVRTGEPIFLESLQAAERYPSLAAQARQTNNKSWAAIPLMAEGRIIGAMGLSFNKPQAFREDDRNFMLALGRQCAQALERAHLYEAERRARTEATRLNVELEQLVRERTAQVRQLASELITSEQTVRQRIAQTLHDDLQQTLYAAKIQLQFLRDEVGRNEELDDLTEMITQSLNLTRQLSVELSPPVLKGEGLREALAWLARHMHELYGLQVSIRANDHSDTASEEQRILLYQIVRELLFNVVKHAGVLEAEVVLQIEDGGLSVTVSDGGQGFDAATILAKTRSGFGLGSMHERLQLFDGRADIDAKPGAGTRIHLFLPHGQILKA